MGEEVRRVFFVCVCVNFSDVWFRVRARERERERDSVHIAAGPHLKFSFGWRGTSCHCNIGNGR